MSSLVPWIDQLADLTSRLGPGLSASIEAVELPPLYHVRQRFPRPRVKDLAGAVAAEFRRPEVRARIRPGARVCIAAGSRGVYRIAEIVRAAVEQVRALDAQPFVIPAMGSHGGATPEGQIMVLGEYGITEETMGCPIVSSLATIHLGEVGDGAGRDIPVFFSRDAAEADAVIPVGRVKPHTGFRGPIESGLMKMLTIGLGKQHGADTLHAAGMRRFGTLLPAAARRILATQPIAFGLAIVENGYDETAHLEAVLPEGLEAREQELLLKARSLMPSLPFERIDVLVIQQIGKNISGSSIDPNICGRFVRSNGTQYEDHPVVQHIAMLDLTPETHGNAAGLGLGDLITLRLLQKLDLPSTYANCLTASHLVGALIPAVVENDRLCIKTAIKTATDVTPASLRLAIIRNTLEIGEFWMSPALHDEARAQPHLEIGAAPAPMEFDVDGNIVSPIACGNK